jgi:excisionase family DNA binding protein
MGFSVNSPKSEIAGEYLTVRSAAEISGYNEQYIRRLLRNQVLKTTKIGQIWLIDQIDFRNYLKNAIRSTDKRFGPHSGPPII